MTSELVILNLSYNYFPYNSFLSLLHFCNSLTPPKVELAWRPRVNPQKLQTFLFKILEKCQKFYQSKSALIPDKGARLKIYLKDSKNPHASPNNPALPNWRKFSEILSSGFQATIILESIESRFGKFDWESILNIRVLCWIARFAVSLELLILQPKVKEKETKTCQ